MQMHLANQAIGAVMMALQKSIMEESDIVPVLQGFIFRETSEGLIVDNPPIIEIENNDDVLVEEQTDAEV